MAAATELRIEALTLSHLFSLAGAGGDLESSAGEGREGRRRQGVGAHGGRCLCCLPLLHAPTPPNSALSAMVAASPPARLAASKEEGAGEGGPTLHLQHYLCAALLPPSTSATTELQIC
jgi:hypothetical protein